MIPFFQVIFSLDLSDSSPGDQSHLPTWLLVNQAGLNPSLLLAQCPAWVRIRYILDRIQPSRIDRIQQSTRAS
jgi:hypothetical protein